MLLYHPGIEQAVPDSLEALTDFGAALFPLATEPGEFRQDRIIVWQAAILSSPGVAEQANIRALFCGGH